MNLRAAYLLFTMVALNGCSHLDGTPDASWEKILRYGHHTGVVNPHEPFIEFEHLGTEYCVRGEEDMESGDFHCYGAPLTEDGLLIVSEKETVLTAEEEQVLIERLVKDRAEFATILRSLSVCAG